MASTTKGEEWLILQKKIFSRWVSQKLWITHHIKVTDVVEDISKDCHVLIYLVEVLSEKKFTGKLEKSSKLRVQQLSNFNAVLKYIFDDCGLVMKIHPSAEDLVDKNERTVLGLLFNIMLKFLKFGDDESEQVNAKDALLLWVKNKTNGYEGVNIVNFTASFHNGLPLCALINKHRPKLLDYQAMDKSDKLGCIKASMNAAEKYFSLEQYLTPAEFTKLDEASMFVYVSEYYYGIAEQRKLDQAARRLGKVIKFTKTCDAMRAQFNEQAQQFKDRVASVEVVLNDRTIDNTMAGAKQKIEEFYLYKQNDKGVIIGLQLALEGLYNNLSMLLAHNKRPEFFPPSGLTLKDIEATVQRLEVTEQERKVALHAELNRQIRLVGLNEHHKLISDKLNSWAELKDTYLSTKEVIESVGAARYSLSTLDAYDIEAKDVKENTVVELKKLGSQLRDNKYEHQVDVDAREHHVDEFFQKLTSLSAAKRPVLDDDLARELFKEKLRIMASQHKDKYGKICDWQTAKKAYLAVREELHSVPEVHVCLALLEAFDQEQKGTRDSSVASLKKLGNEILSAAYKTQYSEYKYHLPQEITAAEADIDTKFGELTEGSKSKKLYLEQCLARETKLEELRVEFGIAATEYTRWVKDAVENLQMAHFGFDLEEVEAYKAELDKEEAQLENQNGEKHQKWSSLWELVKSLENPYTKLTINDMNTSEGQLTSARQERKFKYEKELTTQRANDALCKQFAELADPLSRWVNEQKDTITRSRSLLREQLAFVEQHITSFGADGAKRAEIDTLQEKIDKAGVTNNRHTILTAKDVNVQWVQYSAFLEKKKQMLETEIEHEERRGITEEQFKEIDNNWAEYQKGDSLDLRGLKACLYSLGEELSKEGLTAVLTEHGDGHKVAYKGFRSFMLHLFGDTDTKEEIVNGWVLIARGDDLVTEERMNLVMADADVAYVKQTAELKDNAYNYRSWTEVIFSR
eukprot:TRINITY_DN6390_c1_g1_i1.p1 TRINITY_DN6390_c1_g1~~TRINITY_DN6390_c1_g1_i1.p1  ORF type:complete len:974 (-),score=347.49 TRINITY_DN6390_c1_g1_i1:92-3013(-)